MRDDIYALGWFRFKVFAGAVLLLAFILIFDHYVDMSWKPRVKAAPVAPVLQFLDGDPLYYHRFRDNETGVEYIYTNHTITPRLNADGTLYVKKVP